MKPLEAKKPLLSKVVARAKIATLARSLLCLVIINFGWRSLLSGQLKFYCEKILSSKRLKWSLHWMGRSKSTSLYVFHAGNSKIKKLFSKLRLFLFQDGTEMAHWPPWLITVKHLSHTLITFNSAVNFLIYAFLWREGKKIKWIEKKMTRHLT